MRKIVPALALLPVLLTACEPSWRGTAPVTMNKGERQSVCGSGVTVTSGDTVYSISRRCNVSVRDLIEANSLQAPYTLVTGTFVRMPGAASDYMVQKGDSLSLIAKRLRVDLQSLARVNNKTAPYLIYPGEKLRVPGSFDSSQTQTASRGGGASAESQRGVAVSSLPPPVIRQPAPSASAPSSSSGGPYTSPPPSSVPSALPAPQTPPPLAGRGFIWPVKGDVLADFGPLSKGQNNDGINIAAPRGTAIKAAENGVVAYVGNELKGFGNLLLIKHSDGWMTAYAHADQITVKKGDVVKKGQQVGTVGTSGNVAVPQLHFELRRGTDAVNPNDYLA